MPDLVLNEIVFEELDNRFLYLQSFAPARTSKKGDKVYFGLQVDDLSLEEYNELKKQDRVTAKSDVCVQELLQRGHQKLVRSWHKSLTGTLGEQQTYKISKDIFLNAEPLDMPDEITGLNYIISDEETVRLENIQILLQNIQNFYNEGCRKIENSFYQKIGSRQIYVFKPIEAGGEPKMLKYPNFIFPTDEMEYQTIMGNRKPFKYYHCLEVERIDFSWYRIWRLLFRNMILEQLAGADRSVFWDFIASR